MRRILTILFAACAVAAMALEPGDSITYMIEAQASVSSGNNTPFWLVSNKQGLGSARKNNGYLRAAAFRPLDHDGKWGWGAGADLVAAYHYPAAFHVHQLYAEGRFMKLRLMLGSKEMRGEFNNPRLSSGDLFYSGNALPIPQLRIAFDDYINVPGTRGWFGFKGHFALGMFTDEKWQLDFTGGASRRNEGVLYHSKGVTFKVGNYDKAPFMLEGGLQMAAQFGGKIIDEKGNVTKFPSKIKDIIKVIFAQGGGSDTPIGEQTNVYGNHLGEWNACLTWMPKGSDWSAKAYYEHFFEDHSMMFFEYVWHDGLYGLELTVPRNPVIKGIVYEYLYSKDQAGPVYNDTSTNVPEQVSGRDNYYNHSFYVGWQHWGMGIGNPLYISPVYNDGIIEFMHNRIVSHHLGFEGSPTDELSYRALFSHTRSWGTYRRPTDKVMRNTNVLLEVTYAPHRLKGWQGTLAIGADFGDILGRSNGAMLTIRKTGRLF